MAKEYESTPFWKSLPAKAEPDHDNRLAAVFGKPQEKSPSDSFRRVRSSVRELIIGQKKY